MHTIDLKGAGTRKGECRHFYDCLQPLETIMNYNNVLKKDLIAMLVKKEAEVQALTRKVEELELALQRNQGVMEQRPLLNENREKILSFVQNKELLLRFQRAFGTKEYDARISTNGAEWRPKGVSHDTPWNAITEHTFSGR